MFNFNIDPRAETVPLGYLETLPLFGSTNWLLSDFQKIRTRALFRLDTYTKEQMLLMFVGLKMALLVETLPKSKDSNDAFRLVSVNIARETRG